MSLSSYRTFTKIVENGNLASAAKELHLSPSAISKQLSTLEQRLGAALIQRSTRSVQVTDIGEQFYRRCSAILRMVDEAESEVVEMSEEISGRLRVTLPQSLACAQFATQLMDFQRLYPAINLDLSVSNSVVNLIDNKVDVAFRAGALEDSRLIATPLFQANIVICASPEYLRTNPAPKTPSDMEQHRLLVPSPHYLPTELQRLPKAATARANYTVCEDLGLLIDLVKAGYGVGLLWDYFVQAHLDGDGLMVLKSPLEHSPRPLSLVHLSRDYLPKRIEHFLRFFRTRYRP